MRRPVPLPSFARRVPTPADLWASLALAAAWVAIVRPGGLDLPFFWDEADVYVPGSIWVAEHGLDVTPGVFPDDYSRGHPPLLYLLAGAAFRAFGATPTVGHLVVLPFTVLALAGTYLLGAALFDRRVGMAAALGLGVTPLFMSMGNMLLPEAPLTALAVLSFLALSRGRIGVAAAAGVAAVWMKETGIFAAAGVGAAVLLDAWWRGALREARGRIAVAALPLVALLAFFGWQKVFAGYFVFPHHANLLADRPFEAIDLLTVFPSLLVWHGRWVVMIAAAVGAGIAWRRFVGESPDAPRWRPSRRAVLAGIAVVVLGNAAFFAKMFWLERYALPAHPLLLVAAGGALFAAARGPAWRQALPWAAVAGTALIGAASMRGSTTPDAEEHTFAYADVIATHRAAFRGLDDDARVLTTWPLTVELEHPYVGFVERGIAASELQYARPGERFTHVIVNAASSRADDLRDEARRRGLRRHGTHRVGLAPAVEVWGP